MSNSDKILIMRNNLMMAFRSRWRRLLDGLYQKLLAERVDTHIASHLLSRQHIFGGDLDKVSIAPTAVVNNALLNVSSGVIRVEENVSFGHNVCLLTGAHDPAKRGADRQHTWVEAGHDILIRKGAWLASNVTVLGPADIGEDAVIAAGSVVRGKIPPRVLAAGVPAKVIKQI